MTPKREPTKTLRIVFDTNTVLSALLFPHSRLAWLRQHWRSQSCTPLISPATAAELTRVLNYPKFRLAPHDQLELLSDYLPFCDTVLGQESCPIPCRDPKDQPFLNLAHTGNADILVTGDQDLLTLIGQTTFTIENPETYKQRFPAIAE